MTKCICCNYSVEFDPIKAGGSLPPNFHHRKVGGQVYTLCSGCIGDMMPGTNYDIDDPAVPIILKKKLRKNIK